MAFWLVETGHDRGCDVCEQFGVTTDVHSPRDRAPESVFGLAFELM